jgi:DNA-binding response OmpR family regulator
MSLRALVLCSDEKIVRILRRVLSDLEIGVEQCTDPDTAIRKLTRERFEAVVVDCANEAAAEVLKSSRSAPSNKHAIAIAIMDSQKAVHTAPTLGAHFTLCKPITSERAKASFRAARALMKCERRRHTRVEVEFPVALVVQGGEKELRAVSSDLSEGGIAIQIARRPQRSESLHVKFTLPGSDAVVECAAEIAWEGIGTQVGLRFVDLTATLRDDLRSWLARHSSEIEQVDPPVPAGITDLSLGACYLKMSAPFPVRSRVVLSMRPAGSAVQAMGVVRVMHPEIGMGVEFSRSTPEESQQVEKLINQLMSVKLLPELYVEPQGMVGAEPDLPNRGPGQLADPLLDLFHSKAQLNAESFFDDLRRQRKAPSAPLEACFSS